MKARFSQPLIRFLVFATGTLHSFGMEPFETITIPSEDALSITADFYPKDDRARAPIIVLFPTTRFKPTVLLPMVFKSLPIKPF